ncbi:hypothetical protein Fcan01_20765 [Folsomia candida]|uniref:Uncharacterized protein n=1 Tax=Folsomia candida TaxID=158441 RepID=A0A226DGY2_FOLCA|nr:hypothetical protein Fcan01_20765 [Folsomia candida]
MTKDLILQQVRRHLKLGNQLRSIFVKWDKHSNQITLVPKKKEKIIVTLSILQFLVIIAKIWTITSITVNLIESFLGIAILAVSITTFLLRCHISSDYVQAQFLNCILLSKDGRNHGKQSHFLNYLVLFFDATELSYYIISSVHWLLVMFLPCQPGLISATLCSSNGLINANTIKLLFAAMEFLVFMQSGLGAAYYIITLLLTGVTFVLIECGTFVKLHKMGVADQIEYRRVQILEKLLNACTRKQIFLTTALIAPACQMTLSFVAVKLLHSGHGLMAVAFMWMYLVVWSFTVITFSAAAKLYGVSQKWITECKRTDRKKCARKFQISLKPLRLEFGNNFVEVLTPLVVQEFCLSKTVSFLLATK